MRRTLFLFVAVLPITNNVKLSLLIVSIPMLLVFAACNNQSKLDAALSLAGNNKNELEKVLDYYSNDSSDIEKYKAARFLMENMLFHYSGNFSESEWYYSKIDSLFHIKDETNLYHRWKLIRELKKVDTEIQNESVHNILDLENVTAEYLINHIENIFKAKQYPWYREMEFEDFCEYVLPYRITDEPLEDWASIYRERLSALVDSFHTENFKDTTICKFFIPYFFNAQVGFRPYTYSRSLPPSLLLNMQVGTCEHLSLLGLFLFRSLGIPVAWDFTPQWGNRGNGHDWIAYVTKNKTIPFQLGDNVDFGEHLSSNKIDKLPKVFRRTFSNQKDALLYQTKEDVPAFFKNIKMKDVSRLYFDAVDVEVNLDIPSHVKKEIAYISVFNNKEWVPVHWGKIRKGKAIFTQMGKDCVYLVQYYDKSQLYPASWPFILDANGGVRYLKPEKENTRGVLLKRKYRNHNYSKTGEKILGGKFQIANNSDFKGAADIHVITDFLTDMLPTPVILDTPAEGKYFRYLSAENGYVNMAEIKITDENEEILSGEIIGTEGSFRNDRLDKTKVFDDDPLTYFYAPTPSGAWVGLAFEKTRKIKKISYTPRNDDNFINAGEEYELYYFDRYWVSLGKKQGNISGILKYGGVPENALLWLRNLTKGNEERIFTHEKGIQIWW